MARYRGQKALYEVIGKGRSRKTTRVGPLRPEADAQAAESREPPVVLAERRWRRPRPVQFNAGRLELSLPYPVVGLVLAALLVSALVAYRAGQQIGLGPTLAATEPSAAPDASVPDRSLTSDTTTPPAPQSPLETDPVEGPGPSVGDAVAPVRRRGNAIGILSYRDRTQLVPVGEHFGRRGIATEIVRVENGFILVTQERFADNPARPGSDGYELLQRVIEVGAAYRPPAGFLGFTRESFAGAHGVLLE